MFCIITVLPTRGGATIRQRWPLPSGATMSITRPERSFRVGSSISMCHPLLGIERGQVVEVDLVADVLGVLEVDLVDLDQGEVALALARRADAAVDGVAGAQAEPADL